MWNIPNILTSFRIFLIPVMVYFYYLPADVYEWKYFATAFIFWFAAITDALDGYLARKLDQSTPFGAFFDPVADKVMVAVAFIVAVDDYTNAWVAVPAMIIVGREIVISALREWMAQMGHSGDVSVSMVGKFKTAAQMLALIGLLWHPNEYWVFEGWLLGPLLDYATWFFLYTATLLTVWSLFIYFKAAWPFISGKKD
ncbi:CDP-diacylglycerol--glycerol-3-phosphate 3-phosphatidyltransferase [Psychrosphaera haliotis]|uniref:CDP-diacylglycerol--glycerol-3-phosphate 3-phosphatidyltransferase n=1 Tax=Psychrosphaera haliotis TaxID=555083 RepID=A0A6N8FBG4_9GAMM|nr:CDP-diacylglycerol--glycerol-3-phosphate 3-phosphatidyltransferase [Psychrosphaera haliotis]MUH72092.1 CDP-diacylglycerol--glycerol-3-phosphate 3-phosphatidyltransferase [Psychrosphaera haliotis]